MSLVYIERLLSKTGALLNFWNWGGIVLITLIEASKIWDDDSLENQHFPRVMPDVHVRMISELERTLLELISYDLYIKGSDYAKYYFILGSFADEIGQDKQVALQMPPIPVDKMKMLQGNSHKAEKALGDIYSGKAYFASTL